MKTKNIFHYLWFMSLLSTLYVLTACNAEIDNYFSKNKSIIQLHLSSDSIVLDESKPDEVALSVQWNPATNYGDDFITTYLYQKELVGSKVDAQKEYEDGGIFNRSYTNKELQDLLINTFQQKTGVTGTLKFSVTASFEGPRLVIPDASTASVKVRTYGPKQFMADKVFMSGTAVGDKTVEILPSAMDPAKFIYKGPLSVGSINFPIVYGMDNNTISSVTDNENISDGPMDAIVSESDKAKSWKISEAGNYYVTIDFSSKTVSILPAGDVVEVNNIYLAGSAVEGREIEVKQTLENENLYAFRGELKSGSLYLPILFDGQRAISIAPEKKGENEIADGKSIKFNQVANVQGESPNYWNIPFDGVYRIVVDIDNKTITIYSPNTDLKSKEVSWNNTVEGINPYVSKVETLWMYGGFNAHAYDPGSFVGFQDKYKLTQSLANPYVFVYHGETLPCETIKDDYDKSDVTGAVKFCVSNINNNVYAYGSTADAKRGDHNGYTKVSWGQSQKLVEGQKDNRYAYFLIPPQTNYVMVDIEKLIVVFDSK